jgi:hypothetical protein
VTVALSFLIVSLSFAFVVVAVFRYRDIQKSVGNEIFDLVYELAVATPPNYYSSNTTLL